MSFSTATGVYTNDQRGGPETGFAEITSGWVKRQLRVGEVELRPDGVSLGTLRLIELLGQQVSALLVVFDHVGSPAKSRIEFPVRWRQRHRMFPDVTKRVAKSGLHLNTQKEEIERLLADQASVILEAVDERMDKKLDEKFDLVIQGSEAGTPLYSYLGR